MGTPFVLAPTLPIFVQFPPGERIPGKNRRRGNLRSRRLLASARALGAGASVGFARSGPTRHLGESVCLWNWGDLPQL